MPRRVGVPRALLYHRYAAMWETFLETLGCEVVLSPPTNGALVRSATAVAEGELCLPVKVHLGHAAALDGEVDVLFVPRVVAVDGSRFTCPKLLGLPDMTRALGLSTPVLDPTFDLHAGRLRFLRDAYRLARSLDGGRIRSARAVMAALRAQRRHDRAALRPQRRVGATASGDGRPLRIGVASHPYNLFDEHVSLRLLERLTDRGCEVLTPEQIAPRALDGAAAGLPKDVFWTYEREIVGAVRHWLEHDMVDGIVYLLSFACGPDSFMQVVIQDEVHAAEVPMMSLVLDEHSAEAGFLTRLEAFMDMLERRAARDRVEERSVTHSSRAAGPDADGPHACGPHAAENGAAETARPPSARRVPPETAARPADDEARDRVPS